MRAFAFFPGLVVLLATPGLASAAGNTGTVGILQLVFEAEQHLSAGCVNPAAGTVDLVQ